MTTTLSLPSALELDSWQAPFLRPGASVFLDYDGTLTPIVSRPELATLSESMRDVLRRLSARFPVAIVSGRDIGVVGELVGIDGFVYVGSHGLDIQGPPGSGLRKEIGREAVPDLNAAEAALRRGVSTVQGAVVERKRFSLSTHVRLVASGDRPSVEALVAKQAKARSLLRLEGGKMLFELRPDVVWDKGAAVLWLLDAAGLDAGSALFIGDDLTDETVFQAMAGRGTTVVVSSIDRPTAAHYRVRDPDEVRRLLERVVDLAGSQDPVPGRTWVRPSR